MRVLYLVNGLGFSENMPIGGADKRISEIGKILLSRGWDVSVLTTAEGCRVILEDGLKAQYFVTKEPIFWSNSWRRSVIGRSISYIYLTVVSVLSVPKDVDFDFIYSSSDYFFDLIPAIFLRLRFKKSKLIGISHHHIDVPWKRKGNFVTNALVFSAQRLDFALLKLFDLVFVPKNFEGEIIRHILNSYGISDLVIKDFQNGVNINVINSYKSLEKKYSACFIGGFRASKGIFDLVPVWKKVLERIPNASLLVIGGGAHENENKFKLLLKNEGLSDSVIIAGVIPQSKIFEYIKSCKVFLSPSYEEGWGIAVLEALACGLPVVAYNLPAYAVFSDAVSKVQIGNSDGLAVNVVKMLTDSTEYERMVSLGLNIAKNYDWDNIADYEIESLKSI